MQFLKHGIIWKRRNNSLIVIFFFKYFIQPHILFASELMWLNIIEQFTLPTLYDFITHIFNGTENNIKGKGIKLNIES